jgi:hypothetical protein
MDDSEALAIVNHDIPLEKLQSLVRQGNTTSFIFSIKNRVGGLARALKVFQVNFNEKTKRYNFSFILKGKWYQCCTH